MDGWMRTTLLLKVNVEMTIIRKGKDVPGPNPDPRSMSRSRSRKSTVWFGLGRGRGKEVEGEKRKGKKRVGLFLPVNLQASNSSLNHSSTSNK